MGTRGWVFSIAVFLFGCGPPPCPDGPPAAPQSAPQAEPPHPPVAAEASESDTYSSNYWPGLRIWHIDVEQADATLLVGPQGKSLLVDSGKNGHGPRIMATMDAADVEQIDFYVNTHYHEDHYGGIDDLVNSGVEVVRVQIPFCTKQPGVIVEVSHHVFEQGRAVPRA